MIKGASAVKEKHAAMNKKWYFVLVPASVVLVAGSVVGWWLFKTDTAKWAEQNTGPWLLGAAVVAFGGVFLTVIVQGVIASIANDNAIAERVAADKRSIEEWKRQTSYEAHLRLLDEIGNLRGLIINSNAKFSDLPQLISAFLAAMPFVPNEEERKAFRQAYEALIDNMGHDTQGTLYELTKLTSLTQSEVRRIAVTDAPV